MLTIGMPIYLLFPDSTKKRILHPSTVVSGDGTTVVAAVENRLALTEGAEVVAFYEVRNKFVQQGAVVLRQEDSALQNTISFKLTGEAVSAESRQTYRVSVAVANLIAKIGKESDCLVVDISPEGFAAIAKNAFQVGTSVKVDFTYEGHTVSASARIQTVKTLASGRFRYGFLIAEKLSPARKALTAITMLIQRQQLKRLSAAA